MKILYIIPCFLLLTLQAADRAEVVENLGKYSNNPSARASQSALMLEEGLQTEAESVCDSCGNSVTEYKELCWKCSLKAKIKLFFQKIKIFNNQQPTSSPLRSPQINRKTTSYKKPKEDSLWHFLCHHIAWRK